MLGQLRRLLVHPRAVVEARQTALTGPLGLVFALGVVAVGGTLVPGLVLIEERMPSLLPETPTVSFATGSGAVSVPRSTLEIMVLSLLSPFAFWLLTALVVHVLTGVVALAGAARSGRPSLSERASARSPIATGFGRFRRTLVAVGWGYAPQVLASLVTAAALVPFTLAGPDVLPRAMLMTPAGHTVVDVPTNRTLTLLTHGVGAASVVWTGYVWVGGLQATRGVSRRTALVAVTPVALVLLFVSDLVGNVGLVG